MNQRPQRIMMRLLPALQPTWSLQEVKKEIELCNLQSILILLIKTLNRLVFSIRHLYQEIQLRWHCFQYRRNYSSRSIMIRGHSHQTSPT